MNILKREKKKEKFRNNQNSLNIVIRKGIINLFILVWIDRCNLYEKAKLRWFFEDH